VLFLFSGCGGDSSSWSKSKSVVGAATDAYLIGSDVSVYDLSGMKISSECKTKDFGLFDCKLPLLAKDEDVIIVIQGGVSDRDGELQTSDDQTLFSGSLMALATIDRAVIVSPLTSMLVAKALNLDHKIVVDSDQNRSYFDGVFTLDKSRATVLSRNKNLLLQKENNLAILHILNTKDEDFVKEQVINVTQELENNISVVSDASSYENDFRLHILHVNDTHSHVEPFELELMINSQATYAYVGGYAKLAAFFKEKEALDPNTLVLHAGDMIQGTLYYNLFGGIVSVEAFNTMHLDAMTLGNHAFDRGADNLRDNFLAKVDFPVLGANIEVSDTQPRLQTMIKPYVVKDLETKRVAVVGLTVDSSNLSSPGPTIAFADVIDTAQKEVEDLEAKGINKIIFLTHIGYDKDQLLAQTVQGIDLIVGGHSHTLVGDFSNVGLTSAGSYPTVIKDNERQTLVVTAWKWEAVVGDIDLFFDEEGKVINYVTHPVMLLGDEFLRRDANGTKEEVNASVLSSIKEFINYADNLKLQNADPSVTGIIEKYKPEIDKLMKSVIGRATADLIHVRLPGDRDVDTGIVLKDGSLIAPIVAKSMYEKVEAVDSCDFAFVNAGGVRRSIPQGDITIGEVEEMLPFGNSIVTFSMSGQNLKDMFEDAIDRSLIKKEDTGSFLYFWDVSLSIDQTKAKGERITQFEIYKDGAWIALDENESYRVATNSYIASGGYYVQMQSDATDKYDTGFVVSNTFIEYVKKEKVLSPL